MAKTPVKLSKVSTDIDRLGTIKEEMSALAAEEKRLETRLRRRMGKREGAEFDISVWEVEQRRLDPNKVSKKLGSIEFAKCFSSLSYVTSRVTRKK